MKKYRIYCDGACSGNPGIGGYGIIIEDGEKIKKISGGKMETTNNRMELTAAIKAIKEISAPSELEIFTDSQYLVLGITKWINGWLKNGWKNAQKKEVKNKDLWKELLEISKPHRIKWHWLKGHSGHKENEECDRMARNFIKKLQCQRR